MKEMRIGKLGITIAENKYCRNKLSYSPLGTGLYRLLFRGIWIFNLPSPPHLLPDPDTNFLNHK